MSGVPTGALVLGSALATAAAVALVAAGRPGRRSALRHTLRVLGPAARKPTGGPGSGLHQTVDGALRHLPGPVQVIRRRARRRALAAALPDTADLLTVSMHAGLNVPLALRRVAVHAPEPLRAELDRVNGEVALGTPLAEALASLAARTGVSEVGALVSILTGADRLGGRVSDAVEQWADDLWTRHRHESETWARRAPVKILFPLIFLILPGFILTTVVPLVLSTVRTLGW